MLADAQGLNFSVYDESFFIAFDFVKDDPIKLSAAPHGCSATVGVPENELKHLQALNKAFGGQPTAGNANAGRAPATRRPSRSAARNHEPRNSRCHAAAAADRLDTARING